MNQPLEPEGKIRFSSAASEKSENSIYLEICCGLDSLGRSKLHLNTTREIYIGTCIDLISEEF